MIGNRKWFWPVAALVVVLITVSVVALLKSRNNAGTAQKAQANVEIEFVSGRTANGIEILPVPIDVQNPGLFPANGYLDLQKELAGVKPSVSAYDVNADLSDVANLEAFRSLLSPEKTRLIARNRFVVTPGEYNQMFSIYQNNECKRPEKIPSFITTDSMLHTYHVFYDYSLRAVESGPLFDALLKLTEGMLRASQHHYDTARDESIKEAARLNTAYFAVARQLLDDTPPPDNVSDLVKADVARISSHSGRGTSKCVGTSIDFTQFIPRGHYTRSDKLKRYFKAMMWYGTTSFTAEGPKARIPTLRSLMMVRDLRTVKYQGKVLYDYWNTIYEPTVFYVGKADDYTVYDYAEVSDRVFGKSGSIDALADDSKVVALRSAISSLPASKIKGNSRTRNYRFMGQKYIPDSRAIQEIGEALWPGNPSGLDVFAAMGSARALQIRENSGLNAHDDYHSAYTRMRIELQHTPLHIWQSNLYWGWLWSLKSIIKPAPVGYPSFMRSEAWVDKSLYTALGSWTELRHDTILYTEQAIAECYEPEAEEPPQCKGYVEPNLEFWIKLKWLNEYTMEGLEQRILLSPELKARFTKMGNLIEFCRRISVKELTNQKLTGEEYDRISGYGGELESLTASFADKAVTSEVDGDMAVVADVFTNRGPGGDECLEEGTGRAAVIYVVVPIEGRLYLTRGALYTHYEFSWPASDRLTDEKWQKILRDGREPRLADWTMSFLARAQHRTEE